MKKSIMLSIFAILCFQAQAQWTEEQKILAQAPGFPFVHSSGDEMGHSVSIDGDYAIVGLPKSDISGEDSGMAFLYHWNGNQWVEEHALFPLEGTPGSQFGFSVSITGSTALVGAVYDNGNGLDSGCAYIFEKDQGGIDNWGLLTKISAIDGLPNDYFGWSVALSGTIAVVGAQYDDGIGINSGSAYVFERNHGGEGNWGQIKKLTASDEAAADNFGFSVDVSGTTAIIGAYANDDSGAAYIFEKDQGGVNNWGQLVKLSSSDGATFDNFGLSVALSGDFAIVGARLNDDDGSNSGSAYIFEKDQGGLYNWGELIKITASDAAHDDLFGSSVSISGNRAIVAATGDTDHGVGTGSAYIFEKDHGGSNTWGQVSKLTATDGATFDHFGQSVALSGNTIFAGAFRDDDQGTNSGSVYVFDEDHGGSNNWGQLTKLTGSNVMENADDNFGYSVAISGTTALVGARYDDDNGLNSGSAYIFEKNLTGIGNWVQIAKLTAIDGEPEDYFGWSVAISGSTALVGAYLDDDNGVNSGSVYIFEKNEGGIDSWGQLKKLTAADGLATDQFGWSVAISGSTALVGARLDNTAGIDDGSAYIFEREQGGSSNWGQLKKLTASDGATGDLFGFAVAISGTTALIGARNDDDNGVNSGSAYIFEQDEGGSSNWGELKKLSSSDGSSDDDFGFSVAISDTTALIGARNDDDNGSNSGSAYVFEQNQGGTGNWGQFTKVTPSDGAVDDGFGYSVALSGSTVLVGAYGDDDNGSNSGSAYVFEKDHGGGNSWGEFSKLGASDGLAVDRFGTSVALSGSDALIGAYGNDESAYAAGAAYFFSAPCNPDLSPPTIICPTDISVNNDLGLCTANIAMIPPTVGDNCPWGNGLAFDGVDDFVSIGAIGNAHTIEFWMNVDDSFNSNQDYNMIMNFNNSDLIYLAIGSVTSSISNETFSLVTAGGAAILSIKEALTGWTHVAIVSDGINYNTIYINGSPVTTYSAGGPTNVININSVDIGQRASSPEFRYHGVIDELRFWDSPRTLTEIQSNISIELDAQSGLTGLYHFNEGQAFGNNLGENSSFDSSGFNNNGTLNNFDYSGCNSNWVSGFNGITIVNDQVGSCLDSVSYPLGTTVVTWTATDASGNSSTCTQHVTVNDTELPSINCPSNITETAMNDSTNHVVLFNDPTVSDNCGSVNIVCIPASGSTFPIGTTTVTCKATDGFNNEATCTFDVTIEEGMSCPSDFNLDSITDGLDFGIFLGNFGLTCNVPPCPTDLNVDGITDGTDFGIFLGNFGLNCP